MFQPVALLTGGGASFTLPSGAPSSAHVAKVLICSCVKDGSFEKWPQHGSANHGGMVLLAVTSLIAGAKGRVCR